MGDVLGRIATELERPRIGFWDRAHCEHGAERIVSIRHLDVRSDLPDRHVCPFYKRIRGAW